MIMREKFMCLQSYEAIYDHVKMRWFGNKHGREQSLTL